MDHIAQATDSPTATTSSDFAAETRNLHSTPSEFCHSMYNAQHTQHGSFTSELPSQVAISEGDMQSWNSYLVPISADNPNIQEYGLSHPVSEPLDLNGNALHADSSAQPTQGHPVWTVNFGQFPDQTGAPPAYGNESEHEFMQSQPSSDFQSPVHRPPGQHPYAFQQHDSHSAPLVPSNGWSDQNGQTPMNFQQQQETTPKAEHHLQLASLPGGRTYSPPSRSRVGTKRDRAQGNENHETAEPVRKKRGSRANAVKLELVPVENTAWLASPHDLVSSSSSTSLNSYAGSTTSYGNDMLAHQSIAESESGHLEKHQDEYLVSPRSTNMILGAPSSIPESPYSTATPMFTTTPPSYTSPIHHRSSFSSTIGAPTELYRQSQHEGIRQRTNSEIDITTIGPLPKDQKARNRLAATKCRQKSKAAVTRLEEEEKVMAERNAMLTDLASRLKDEVYVLRSQLLMHSDCQCTLIHDYLRHTASLLAQGVKAGVGSSRRVSSVSNTTERSDIGNSDADDDAEGEEDDEQMRPAEVAEMGWRGGDRRGSSTSVSPASSDASATLHAITLNAAPEVGRRAGKQRVEYSAREHIMGTGMFASRQPLSAGCT